MGPGEEDALLGKVSGIAARIKNIDGKVMGADGKPLIPRRRVGFVEYVSNMASIQIQGDKVSMANDSNIALGLLSTSKESSKEVQLVVEEDGNKLERSLGDGNVVKQKEPISYAEVVRSENSANFRDDVKETGNNDLSMALTSYVPVVESNQVMRKVNFRSLSPLEDVADADVAIPFACVKEVTNRFANTLYGYFLGKRLAYPIVENYVKNSWAKYGLARVMMNSKGFFFFKFATKKGMEQVLENGPWIIRTIPIILNTWTPNVSLMKEDTKRVPVWVKLHNVPIAAFSEDGLSMLATKLGRPIMLDSFTSSMCLDSWGRNSYARALIEINSECDLIESLVVAIPIEDGSGYTKETIEVEYEWRPPRCEVCKIFGHSTVQCLNAVKEKKQLANEGKNTDGFKPVIRKSFRGLVIDQKKVSVGKSKQVYVPKKKTMNSTSSSNQFEILNASVNMPLSSRIDISNDMNFHGVSESSEAMCNANSNLQQVDPEIANSKKENKNLELVEDDCDSDVEDVYDETSQLMASTKGEKGSGFGNNNLYEHWKEDQDYNPYDDDEYNTYDLSADHLACCDAFDIKLPSGRK